MPKYLKRLCWYAALATIALLAYWNTRLKTADSTIIAADALHHVLGGTDQSNTSVKRYLTSNSDMMKRGDNESRGWDTFRNPVLKFIKMIKAWIKNVGAKLRRWRSETPEEATDRIVKHFELDKILSDASQKERDGETIELFKIPEFLQLTKHVIKAYHGNEKQAYQAINDKISGYLNNNPLAMVTPASFITSGLAPTMESDLAIRSQQRGLVRKSIRKSLDLLVLSTKETRATRRKDLQIDYKILKLLSTAATGDDIPAFVVQEKNKMLQRWLGLTHDRDYPIELFKALKLKKKNANDVINDPMWSIWISFVEMYVSKVKTMKPSYKMATAAMVSFNFLKIVYDSNYEFLKKLTVAAKKVPAYEEYAEEWEQRILFRTSENDMDFSKLPFDKIKDPVFLSDECSSWVDFVVSGLIHGYVFNTMANELLKSSRFLLVSKMLDRAIKVTQDTPAQQRFVTAKETLDTLFEKYTLDPEKNKEVPAGYGFDWLNWYNTAKSYLPF